jgi:hypothetical protein
MATLIEPFMDDFSDISVGSVNHRDIFGDCSDCDDDMSLPPVYAADDLIIEMNAAVTPSPKAATAHMPSFMESTLAGGPRVVSLPSMSRVSEAAISGKKKRSSNTPYDALKELIQNKKKRRRTESNASATSSISTTSTSTENSTSSALCLELPGFQCQQQQNQSVPVHSQSELHRTCAHCNDDDIQHLFQQESLAYDFAAPKTVFTTKLVYNFGTYQMEPKENVPESYTYPLPLAIRNNKVQTSETLELLMEAAPQILAMPDGDALECPLSVLLKSKWAQEDKSTIVAKFLAACPDSVYMLDRKGNSPLHIAARYGASLDIVQQLVAYMDPQSLLQRNHFGETSLSIAQRATHQYSNAVATFLWEKHAEALS